MEKQMSRLSYSSINLAAAGLVLLLIILLFAGNTKAQSSASSNENGVLVNSWKRGNSRISEQRMTVNLDRDMDEYEFDIYDTTKQKHYRLHLRQFFMNTIRKPSIPCWSATLKEVTRDAKTGGNIIGYNLLTPEGPGVGHYFPREIWAGALCPVEKPQGIMDNSLYPIKAERKFLVENFSVVMQVLDYELDEQANRLSKVTLRVELKNQ
jgi:hypothetical protein